MRIDKPLSREESKRGDIIPPGIYTYEVMEAIDDVSKKTGNDQIKLKLKIYMPDGRERIMFDYLINSMEFKLAHFCESNSLWDKYESGNLEADDCYGKSGECKIYTQKAKDGYPEQAAIGDYLLTTEQSSAKLERKIAAAKQDPAQEGFVDSDLLF